MKGRYPICCLFLEIDPAAVDVNIHPAKREVKFHREPEIRRLVAQAIRETLLAFHVEPEKTKTNLNAEALRRREEPVEAIGKPVEIKPAPELSTPSLPEFPPPAKPVPEWPSPPAEQPPLRMGFSKATPALAPNLPTAQPVAPLAGATPLLNVPLRLVGVIGKLYVLLESDRGLVLLDQHAAHERILFEQMMNRIEQNAAAPSQKLLLPETIELPPRDAQFLREQLMVLTKLGVGLSEFGERTFLLDALPSFVKATDPRRFVFDLVDEMRAAGREVNLARLGEHTVAKTVCRHAVKANDPLAGPELEKLVENLRHCAMPYTCPHGRPTLIEMSYRELEKKFGRVQ
jgi:DNA mismatch repair protein MutL